MRRLASLVALLVVSAAALTATATACHHRRTTPLGTAIERAKMEHADSVADDSTITVLVRNQGFSEVTVYALPDWGGKVRLGMVPAHTDSVLVVPKMQVPPYTKVRFLLDPFGSDEASETSDEVYITPGDQVMLTRIPGR